MDQLQLPSRGSIFGRLVFSGPVSLAIQLLVLLVSLAAVLNFVHAYRGENEAVLTELDLIAQQTGTVVDRPEDLVRLAHSVCVLDTGISSGQSFLQPMSTTISRGGWCGNYTRVFIAYARSQGYPAQKIHLRTGHRSHTSAEVYYQGQWRAVDPFFGLVFPKADGELATVSEIASDPALGRGQRILSYEDPQLEEIYQSYEGIFGELYRDSLEFQWKLSGSALFHDGVVILSYPVSLVTEGPRRPIIPYWLDRPNLLGAYLSGGISLITALLLVLGWRRWNRADEDPDRGYRGLDPGHRRYR